MIELCVSGVEELPDFCTMEQDEGSRRFVLPYSLAQHRREHAREDIVYLSIYHTDELAGFFILVLEPDQTSIEFRRIVVANTDAGIGQPAIRAMETWCAEHLQRNRIWLDVFEFNKRGRHIYEKLGYCLFDSRDHDGKKLLFYQKNINGQSTTDSDR
ncbi:MAG: GNAT family N-acetyltransferase [Gammaproteobacteria bacterium]|nr:GNAT family N-acetyltransferase [Gammaproteobacteria bacterium]